ncbi:hypothetical protein ACFSL6_23960 [Paenibacillus thailandensis]|uniref:Uncharacterized protein n=1 Tax=Paenibacillus thailandensis TaxID=393250 RepID=A0ABW5R2Q1_9BACL
MDKFITVNHTIEDVNGTPHHVVRLYTPNQKQFEYKIGRWPVTETDDSLDAIWSGVFEAGELCKEFGVDSIAVHSTDTAAFAAYNAEVDAL